MNSIAWHPQRPTAPAARPRRASSARPRIACVHLLTRPSDPRERRSIASVSGLKKHGIKVIQVINQPNTIEPMLLPFACTDWKSNAGIYGCYLAHRDAITEHLRNVDGLLVCECDCVFTLPADKMAQRVYRGLMACDLYSFPAFSFGPKDGRTQKLSRDIISMDRFMQCHCYVVPLRSRDIFMAMFQQPWDTYDLCATQYLCEKLGLLIGAFSGPVCAVQGDGYSINSSRMSTTEQHYRNVRN